MGLEGVELVIALEEEFGIEFSDEEASHCLTPGQVIDVIMVKLENAQGECKCQHDFYALRRTLCKELGLTRETVKLDTPLREIITNPTDDELWQKITNSVTPNYCESLQRPVKMWKWIKIVSALCGISLFFVFLAVIDKSLMMAITMAICAAILCAITLLLCTKAFKKYIPERYQTIRDLIPKHPAPKKELSDNRAKVADLVREITIDMLGINPKEYREDGRFIEDFGMG